MVKSPAQGSLGRAPTVPTDRSASTAIPVRQEYRLKRVVDIVLALVGLVLSAPLWLGIAVAVKLEGWGPVFYRQERWGRGGRRFILVKFRTMGADSDDRYGIRTAAPDDRRITSVGGSCVPRAWTSSLSSSASSRGT